MVNRTADLSVGPIYGVSNMQNDSWFSQLSTKQRYWLFGTTAIIIIIVGFGILVNPSGKPEDLAGFSVDMSIRDIAPTLNVTGKALAREFKLPLDVSKQKPLKALGVVN